MRLYSVRRDERGQALIEYAMIVALIGASLVAILGLAGSPTRQAYNRTSTVVRQASLPAGGPGGGGGGVWVIPASASESLDSADATEEPESLVVGHHP